MRFLIAAAFLLGACSMAEPGSGIRGTVLAGPACPGPARLDSPCPDRPTAMAIEIVQGGTVVTTFTTSDAGTFSIALAPGAYTVRSKTGLPVLKSQSVAVAAGTYTEVVLHADTGIR